MDKKKMESILKDYSTLYTCAVSDAIDELGLEPGFIDPSIRPIYPGARLVGFAATMKMVKFIKISPKFPIMCVDMSNLMIAAGLGQSTSRILQGLGFRGGLVNGPVRDIAQVIDLKFPIFAKGILCSSIRGRMVIDMESVMQPITCGGRIINAGDLIFCDINGGVVVREANIEEVLSTDKWWFEQLEKGRKPEDIETEKPLPLNS